MRIGRRFCACGCGQTFEYKNPTQKFISGHNFLLLKGLTKKTSKIIRKRAAT